MFDSGFFKFFMSFWRIIEFGASFSALLSQLYYSSQKAYTDVAWQKRNREQYMQYVQDEPETCKSNIVLKLVATNQIIALDEMRCFNWLILQIINFLFQGQLFEM